MKFDTRKFALAAAITITSVTIINFILVKLSFWRMGHMGRGLRAACFTKSFCPWGGLILAVTMSFLSAFLIAWAFASIYNKLIDMGPR